MRYLLLGLMMVSGAVAAALTIPLQLPGIGEPVEEGRAQQVVGDYCQPIRHWNLMAWQMCVDSGVQLNRAIREYHRRGCPSRDSDGCADFAHLYASNYRLWDGSVDNVGRAKRMGGARPRPAAAPLPPPRCDQNRAAADAALAALTARAAAWPSNPPPANDVAGLTARLNEVAQEQSEIGALWPNVAKSCTTQVAKLADRFQAVRRDYDRSLTATAADLAQQLSELRQQAACHAQQLRRLAELDNQRWRLRQEQMHWAQTWLGEPLVPRRIMLPSLDVLVLDVECRNDGAGQQVVATYQQLVNQRQQAVKDRNFTLMLLDGAAHYPQRLNSQRWGTAASVVVLLLFVVLVWWWRVQRRRQVTTNMRSPSTP